MKALLVLLLASVCAGQSVTLTDSVSDNHANCRPTDGKPGSVTCVAPPKPLKCGKYAVKCENMYCSERLLDTGECRKWEPVVIVQATYRAPDKPCDEYQDEVIGVDNDVIGAVCVDKMHEVTEKEWQELMARLKALEKVTECLDKPCTLGALKSGKE